MRSENITDLSFEIIWKYYFNDKYLPSKLFPKLIERLDTAGHPEIWISRLSQVNLAAQLKKLDEALQMYGEQVLNYMPLFGLPFAVKDNIDVTGIQTTAACPDFAYTPQSSAYVLQKLEDAGAVLIGKTNLDQFATGLVGTRSPYGVVQNAHFPGYISGGSSSGSAVAVALKLVSFTLGTDTAGSGRVPAGFNGIVGLKPTRGLVSTRGVLPACRTLDCVSIFAQNVQDSWRVLHIIAGFDSKDEYSRHILQSGMSRNGYRIAIPEVLEFCGDKKAQTAFSNAIAQIKKLPKVQVKTLPFHPFVEAAKLLYQGPWVAERRAAVGSFFEKQSRTMDPIVRDIIGQADQFNAVDTFKAGYRLAKLKRDAECLMTDVDFLVVPTAPTMPTIAAVNSDPVARNSELGYYTNFVNFFDLAALSIPASIRSDGLPAGITLIGSCGSDHLLSTVGEELQAEFDCIDTTRMQYQGNYSVIANPLPYDESTVKVAVVGAHLDGQPLNWQLVERGARKLLSTSTSKNYRLYALSDSIPPKPGLARVMEGGCAIELEVWEMPQRNFGGFVEEIPAPLGIGSVQLSDGCYVKGFICEQWALNNAKDISLHGGWRAYLASQLI
jgi:allophanate hydrolase